ncbi:MAG: TetR/AcrR family transcriptional regulator [Rhodoferax sp.]|nr:TetR/AcrR family transcriptional regulator [Rhodoferax sp.]
MKQLGEVDKFKRTPSAAALAPRRNPSQSRSQVTVDAVLEATMQVLVKDGIRRLTTTRVAERAGVSVGTLYQYYPNKQSLLFAVLKRHLQRVTDAVESAARRSHYAPLEVMVTTVVAAFVKAKTEQMDEAQPLYAVASELASAEIVKTAADKGCSAIAHMLATAPDAAFEDLQLTSHVFIAAMVGPTRTLLEGDAPPKLLRALRRQLKSVCLGYLEREATFRNRLH